MTNPLFENLLNPHVGSSRVFLHLSQGKTWTYGEFLERTAQFAHALTESGAKAGDRIAIQVEKSADALGLTSACIQAGMVLLPLNTAYKGEELAYFVENSSASTIVVDESREQVLRPIAERLGATLLTLNADGSGRLSDIADRMPTVFAPATRSLDDLAALLYTSGTTGRPKGAMLTQGNILSNARALVSEWQFVGDDVLYHALPIYHLHGLFVATNTVLLAGSSMIFRPKFTVDEAIAELPNATTMMGVPTFYTRLLADERLDRNLTKHMRLFISGSAPMLASTHKEFHQRTGHHVLERYGMTETNMIASNPYVGMRKPGFVGLPLKDISVRIANPETGEALGAGEIGQIEVNGPNVFSGYWGMPEKTAEDFRDDGYFCTGDLGRKDEDGYVEIVGRNKDLVISGGLNIYPKEVELVLDAHEHVHESAVIGIPNADFGEAVVAVLVPAANEPDLAGIQDHVENKLAKFKCPKAYILAEALPRNAMGKVQKQVLRELHKGLALD